MSNNEANGSIYGERAAEIHRLERSLIVSFDEQPDGDIHGECAAEIHRLEQWQNEAAALLATFIGLSSRPDELEWSKVAIKVPALLAEEEAYEKTDLVPGVVHCARCNFRLNRVTLYMGNGAIGPGGSETEKCPNGCGPMWPVTWKQEAEDAYKTAESQFERAKAAEDQLNACRPYLKEGETVADALARLSRLVNAVDCTDFYGIKCENIDGKNWFDVRGKTKETT